jgi:hypothetical protein
MKNSTRLILYKFDSDALKLLFKHIAEFFIILCHIITHKLVQIYINNFNNVCYEISQLTFQYKLSTTLHSFVLIRTMI